MAFLHGILHSVGRRCQGLIVALDMGDDEVCCVFMMPNYLACCSEYELSVKVRADMLSVVCSSHTDMIFQVWVMKEYGVESSWTQLARFKAKGWLAMPIPLRFS